MNKVTYTATIKDTNPNGTENVVSSSKDVTYKYLNPLTSVTTDEKKLQLRLMKNQQLTGLTGENIKKSTGTEPELNWTYSTDGIAKLSEKNSLSVGRGRCGT